MSGIRGPWVVLITPALRRSRNGMRLWPRCVHGPVRCSSRLLRLAGLALLTALSLGRAGAEPQGLTLADAVRLALERNERASAAEARADAAEARVAKARAFFFPDITFTGTYTRRPYETFRTVDDERVTIQRRNAFASTSVLTLTLFDARSIPLYRQAVLERDAAALSASNDKRLLGFEAGDAFLLTLSADQVRQAAGRRLEFARKNLGDATARYEAQLASSNDVTRAELELATAEREFSRGKGEAEAAYLHLGFLLDTEAKAPLAHPEELLRAASGLSEASEELVDRAQERRLDLAASRQRARALQAFAAEPLLRPVPSLGVTGQYRTTNEGGLANRTRDWFLGASLTWRLFDGGEWFAERRERRALAFVADLDVRAAQRRVALDVHTAAVALRSAQATVRQAEVAAEVATKNAEQTAELYRQGLASALEAADANVRLFEADVALARGRYSLALAFLDLRAALGLDPFGEEPVP